MTLYHTTQHEEHTHKRSVKNSAEEYESYIPAKSGKHIRIPHVVCPVNTVRESLLCFGWGLSEIQSTILWTFNIAPGICNWSHWGHNLHDWDILYFCVYHLINFFISSFILYLWKCPVHLIHTGTPAHSLSLLSSALLLPDLPFSFLYLSLSRSPCMCVRAWVRACERERVPAYISEHLLWQCSCKYANKEQRCSPTF